MRERREAGPEDSEDRKPRLPGGITRISLFPLACDRYVGAKRWCAKWPMSRRFSLTPTSVRIFTESLSDYQLCAYLFIRF